MKSRTHLKVGPKSTEGFLLIEVLTALAILSALVVVVMLSLAHGIQWNHEAQLRLRALNAAKTTLEYLAQGRPLSAAEKKIQGCSITVRYGDAKINQGAHDKKIPTRRRRPTEDFKIVVVTSEWDSSFGEKKSVQLLAGIITKGRG